MVVYGQICRDKKLFQQKKLFFSFTLCFLTFFTLWTNVYLYNFVKMPSQGKKEKKQYFAGINKQTLYLDQIYLYIDWNIKILSVHSIIFCCYSLIWGKYFWTIFAYCLFYFFFIMQNSLTFILINFGVQTKYFTVIVYILNHTCIQKSSS